MKNALFWDVAPCISCAATCSRCFLARGIFYLEYGGDKYLRNVGSHKIYTAPHPRRRYSSKQLLLKYPRFISPEGATDDNLGIVFKNRCTGIFI
jgi:hypothetical protein